jgi:ribosomal protein S18 acetylase RimI-like enzyme
MSLTESPNIKFRAIRKDDFQCIKRLHEEFFPVKYSDEFYRDACIGIGVNDSPLYTCLAVKETVNSVGLSSSSEGKSRKGVDEIVGFIFAQFIPYERSEDKDIILLKAGSGNNNKKTAVPYDSNNDEMDIQQSATNRNVFWKSSSASSSSSDLELFYILTLGVRKEYRRLGLASQLLKNCIDFAGQNPHCGCLYLHVIQSNPAAIAFYEKNMFARFKIVYGK